MTVDLLEKFGIPHRVLGRDHASKAGLLGSWSKFAYRLYRVSKQLRADLMVAEVGAAMSPIAWLLGADSLVFMDAEHATLQNSLVFPFATRICTAESFWKDVGEKQVRYDGYQELTYLHPDRFTPDPSVLQEAGLGPDEEFVILRAVGWNAAHDINAGGFDSLEAVVGALEAEGVTVVVTSERSLPESLESYRLSVEPHRIHHLMYYADLFVGESATMATESAVLGTPAVYVSTLEVGYTADIEQKYGLLFNYSGPDRQERGIRQAKAILNGSYEADWEDRWRRLINDKEDTTAFILEQIRELTGRKDRTVVRS
jgi:predicted glycosyltransferase